MELLDKFILFTGCVAEVFIVFDFYNNFFYIRKIVKSQLKIILYSILVIVILFIINQFGNAYINLFFFPMILWFYVTVLFDADIGKRLFYLVITVSLMVGCEFLFVILLKLPTYFLKQISYTELSNITWQLLAMKLLTYMFFNVFKQMSNKSKNRMSGKIFLMYLCLPIASLGIMLVTYYSGVDLSGNFLIKVMMLICFILMLIGNILMFHAFNIYEKEVNNGLQQQSIIIKKDAELKYYMQVSKMKSIKYSYIIQVII